MPYGMLRSAASPDTRGVRPVRDGVSGLLNDTAPGRPPSFRMCVSDVAQLAACARNSPLKCKRASPGDALYQLARAQFYLIFASRNSTCFLATGSYFFMTSFSVMVREFFLVT